MIWHEYLRQESVSTFSEIFVLHESHSQNIILHDSLFTLYTYSTNSNNSAYEYALKADAMSNQF